MRVVSWAAFRKIDDMKERSPARRPCRIYGVAFEKVARGKYTPLCRRWREVLLLAREHDKCCVTFERLFLKNIIRQRLRVALKTISANGKFLFWSLQYYSFMCVRVCLYGLLSRAPPYIKINMIEKGEREDRGKVKKKGRIVNTNPVLAM